MRRTRMIAVLSAATLLTASACGGSSDTTPSPAAISPAPAAPAATGSTGAAPSGAGTAPAPSSAAEPTPEGPPPAAGGVFTIGVGSDPGNLDPSMTVLSVTRLISRLAYDPLVYSQDDGSVKPGLAKSWTITGKSLVLTMTPGVTCSDGSPFTAKDAADNINYIADPTNKSPVLGTFLPAGSKATADESAGTMTLTTPEPNAFLLQNLSGVFMICASGLKDHKGLANATIGTGPWVLSEVAAEDHYSYTKRDGYTWGPGGTGLGEPGTPDSVNVRVIANPSTMANLVLAGEVNFAAVAGNDAKRLDAAKLRTIDTVSPTGETWFNETEGRPTADVKVREALITGTDIAEITKVAAAGKGGPAKAAVTLAPNPCLADTVTANLPAFDAAKAKSLLDAAGWTVGADGIRTKDGKPLALTFLYPGTIGQSITSAAELLGAQWKELGVAVTLKSFTSVQLNEYLFSTGAWDVGWIAITVSLPSQLVPFVSGAMSPDGTNFGHINNADYTANATKAAASADVATACPLWEAAEVSLYKNFDGAQMFALFVSTYLKNAQVKLEGGELEGSSLRLTQG